MHEKHENFNRGRKYLKVPNKNHRVKKNTMIELKNSVEEFNTD